MFNSQKIKASDVLEVEGALRALVRTKFPEVTAEEGTALNDLVIKSLGYLAAAVKSEADQIKTRLYIPDLEASTTSDTQGLLEDLASNFLVNVDNAPPKRGLVSFDFSTNATRVMPAGILLTRGANFISLKLYDSSEDIVIEASDYIDLTTDGESKYQFTILMETVRTAEDITIFPGDFTSSVAFTGLLGISNTSNFVGVSSTDFTRASIVERMRFAQTLRGFSTRNGIQATIMNEGIPHIKKVVGIGAGDEEMYRDVIPSTLSSSRFHSLGMVNIVVSSLLESNNVTLDPPPPALTISPAKPIVVITAVSRSGTSLDIVSDFGVTRYTRSYGLSTGITTIAATSIVEGAALPANSVSIYVDEAEERLLAGSSTSDKFTITPAGMEGGPTGLQILVDNNIPVIQGLIDSDSYNTLGSSTKCMAATPAVLLIPNLRVRLASGVTSASLNTNILKRVLVDLVNNWTAEYAIPLSEFTTALMVTFGGIITSLEFPQGITYIVSLPDGRSIGYSSSSSLTVADTSLQLVADSLSSDDLLALQVSDRLLNYFLSPADITVEVIDV